MSLYTSNTYVYYPRPDHYIKPWFLYSDLDVDSKHIYPAISTFAVQICYTNKFLLYSY